MYLYYKVATGSFVTAERWTFLILNEDELDSDLRVQGPQDWVGQERAGG